MLPDGLPKRTIGWGVLQWCSDNLVNPDARGGEKGAQWIFKEDQARFILWFYAVDENGNWIYRKAYRERAKGTGKSPMVAAIACAEFLGPTRFSHFDEEGNAVGKENETAIVWLAAVSLDGCRHTYDYIMSMLQGKCERNYNLDVGMTRILVRNRGNEKRIESITASFRSHEGPQPTFAICEETQNWIPSERGPEFFGVISRGLGKTDSRSIQVTNAPVPGEGSVAEEHHKMYRAMNDGEIAASGLLFDTFSVHVQDLEDKDEAMAALDVMYENAPWINKERIYQEILDPNTKEVDARRFYFNEMVDPSGLWISDHVWTACKSKLSLRKEDLISLGFRARKNCAAIVATRLEDSAIFILKMWEKPQGTTRDWQVPDKQINGKMRNLMSTYNVYNVVADPEYFQDVVNKWYVDFEDDVQVEELWVKKSKQKMADAVELFETAVRNGRLKHSGDRNLTRHIMNSFVDEVQQGRLIRQDNGYSPNYIVAAEAAVLSFQGAQAAIEDGALKEGYSGELQISNY